MKFKDLSAELQCLLTHVKESQLLDNSNNDERGFYAEYDSFNCKPWTHKLALELQDCKWVNLHKDSDRPWELKRDADRFSCWDNEEEEEDEDEDEECHGVLFVTIKDEYLDLIPDEVIEL